MPYVEELAEGKEHRAKSEEQESGTMEESLMEGLKVYYDEKEDILYLAKEGHEEEVVELYPGVNIELDESGKLIGVEVFKASILFKDAIKSMERRLQTA